jgi:CubicO group peptidase (beta-lactamase class C family)
MLRLVGDGNMALDASASDYGKEVCVHGQDPITVEQLLTFTAGIPSPLPLPSVVNDREAGAARVATPELDWEPRRRPK